MTIISSMEVIGGDYQYSLPLAFFPDYKRHGIKDKTAYPYTFEYEMQIIS